MLKKLIPVSAVVFLLLAMVPLKSAHAALITTGGGDCYNTVTHVITPGACPAGSGSDGGVSTMKTQGAFMAVTSASNSAVEDQINADDKNDDGQDSSSRLPASTQTSVPEPDVAYCDSSQCFNTAGEVVGSCNSLAGFCYAGDPYSASACESSSECDDLPNLDHKYDTGYQSQTITNEMKAAQEKQMLGTIYGIIAALPFVEQGAANYFQKMVSPQKLPSLYDYGCSLTRHYGQSSFSREGSGAGGVRGEQGFGFTMKGGISTDDWGVSVSVPVQRSVSDGGYSATDNTSYGVSVTPVYHLLREPLHGIALNLGAVLGYEYHSYDDLNKLNDPAGIFALDDYKDDQSLQMGAFFRASQHMSMNSVLSLSTAYVDHRSLENSSVVGRDNAVTTVDLGYLYNLSDLSRFTMDMKMLHISQYSLDSAFTFGEADMNFTHKLTKNISLRAGIKRSFGNDDWTATDGMLSLIWTGM